MRWLKIWRWWERRRARRLVRSVGLEVLRSGRLSPAGCVQLVQDLLADDLITKKEAVKILSGMA